MQTADCLNPHDNSGNLRPATRMIMTDVFRNKALRSAGWMNTYTSKSTSESGLAPRFLIAFANEPINSESRA